VRELIITSQVIPMNYTIELLQKISTNFELLSRNSVPIQKHKLIQNVWCLVPDCSRPEPVVVMVGVHGNEPCGLSALLQFLEDLLEGHVTLGGQSIMFIIANIEALKKEVRAVDHNLNRLFGKKGFDDVGGSLELKRAKEIEPLLRNAHAVLDIHSASESGPAYCLLYPRSSSDAHAMKLPKCLVYNSSDMRNYLLGTSGAFCELLEVNRLVFEAGQHASEAAVVAARNALGSFLLYYGVISPAELVDKLNVFTEAWIVYHVECTKGRSFTYRRSFKNLDAVSRGEIIGWYDSEQAVIAECDCIIILPTLPENLTKDEEQLYYLGRK